MLEMKITELMKKQKLIKKKLDNHDISFLECEEELRALQNEIEKIIQEDTYEARVFYSL